MKFLGGLALAALIFLLSGFSYVGGRIMCPELGLTVPEYWAWFWFNVIVFTAGVIARVGGTAIAAALNTSR